MASQWAAAARLVRRTGFGATGDEVDAVVRQGPSAYVAQVLAADPTKDPGAVKTPVPHFAAIAPPGKGASADEKKAHNQALASQDKSLVAWWVQRMLAVDQPFGEKSTFVWHAHFATSFRKVREASWMAQQNQRLRVLGRGEFGTLAQTMLLDAATMRWLDNEKNTVKGPNENLAREFMEIFTLGHDDGYTEEDVRQGARALTGWTIDPKTAQAVERPKLHDNGTKTFLGVTGDLDARDYCNAVLARPGGPPFIATSLYHAYVSNNAPSSATVAKLVAAYGSDRNVSKLLSTMFTDPSFDQAEGTYIVGPVEWLIGAMRALKVPMSGQTQTKQVTAALNALGQLPFAPPSVGGWPSGLVWMSTAAADLRFRTASLLAQRAQVPAATGSTTAKLESLAHLLGVDTWSAQSLAVLKGSMAQHNQLVAVALNTPEYLVH